jgi:hypothetical protein
MKANNQLTTMVGAAAGRGIEANPFWNTPPTILIPLVTQYPLAVKLVLFPVFALLALWVGYRMYPHFADHPKLSKCLGTAWLTSVMFSIAWLTVIVLNNVAVILGGS